jgi:hypothetical protein
MQFSYRLGNLPTWQPTDLVNRIDLRGFSSPPMKLIAYGQFLDLVGESIFATLGIPLLQMNSCLPRKQLAE